MDCDPGTCEHGQDGQDSQPDLVMVGGGDPFDWGRASSLSLLSLLVLISSTIYLYICILKYIYIYMLKHVGCPGSVICRA